MWSINTYQLYVGLPLIFMSNKDFSEVMYQCVRKKDRNRATWQSFDLISNVTYGDINLLNSWNQTNPNKYLQRLVLPVTWHSKFIQPVSSRPLEPVSNRYMCTFTEGNVLTEINYRPIYLMSLVNICVSTTLDQPTSNNNRTVIMVMRIRNLQATTYCTCFKYNLYSGFLIIRTRDMIGNLMK